MSRAGRSTRRRQGRVRSRGREGRVRSVASARARCTRRNAIGTSFAHVHFTRCVALDPAVVGVDSGSCTGTPCPTSPLNHTAQPHRSTAPFNRTAQPHRSTCKRRFPHWHTLSNHTAQPANAGSRTGTSCRRWRRRSRRASATSAWSAPVAPASARAQPRAAPPPPPAPVRVELSAKQRNARLSVGDGAGSLISRSTKPSDQPSNEQPHRPNSTQRQPHCANHTHTPTHPPPPPHSPPTAQPPTRTAPTRQPRRLRRRRP